MLSLLLCLYVVWTIYNSAVSITSDLGEESQPINKDMHKAEDSNDATIRNHIVLPKYTYSMRYPSYPTYGIANDMRARRDVAITEINDAALDGDQLPSFETAGFEFKNIATIPGISLEDYHEFLHAIPSVTQRNENHAYNAVSLSQLPSKHLSIIEMIFRDFLDEHNLIADEINWHRVKAVTITKRMETHVHIDAYGEKEDRWPIQWKEFNLWIPMHDTDTVKYLL